MSNTKIIPTVGRVVWFFDRARHPGFHRSEVPGQEDGPYAAIIASVRRINSVNLTVFDANGTAHGFMSVPMPQDGSEPSNGCWCEWMPYQKGQAAKTEVAEQALAAAQIPAMMIPLPVVDLSRDAGPVTLEQEIQAKANKGPRVTPADIEAEIVSEHYFTALDGAAAQGEEVQSIWHDDRELRGGETPLGLLTFAVLVLRNGFTVTGESACASPENFDADIGRRVARENAVNKIWPLLGFRLRDQLAATT